MSFIEWIAVAFGLACVALTIYQNIWCWPTGLIQVILYVWIFDQARLYSDVLLQLVYIVLQIYGWYHWVRGGPRDSTLAISRLTPISLSVWLLVSAIGTLCLGFAMHRYTSAALPYWDATITILSLVAQYLLSRKTLENWLFWIAVDVLGIGVYASKHLIATSGLYGVFLVMAICGWLAWKKSLKAQPVQGFDVVAA